MQENLMMYKTILTAETLGQHLNDPNWIILDCRFDLNHPKWGSEEYTKAHIPGALFADLDHDLASPITPTSGRHPLPGPDAWRKTVSNWGIQADTQVVAYDSTGGSLAAVRVWWLLRAYGHEKVALLDGGLPKWLSENRPLTEAVTLPRRPSIFNGSLNPHLFVSSDELVHIYRDPLLRLVDARAAERFRGEIEPIDPVAGHIPGAKNRPVAQNLNADQTFKSAEQLRKEFTDILGDLQPEQVIAYCGSGVTGGHNLLAMEIAGLPGGRLYPGSWSEWIRDPNRPIETGS
jgi:thiosulfate/3-mercaptopyruvate sulfurtransferase